MRLIFLTTLLAAAAGACSPADRVPEVGAAVMAGATDPGRHFGDVPGTFVMLDARTGRVIRHDPVRAATRFVPASTFKIPNSIIALESGVADGPDFALAWDSTTAPREPWWPAAWARDHTLRTALPASAVWYYQELARRTGAERMQAWLDRLDYGNRQIGNRIDRFWLDGPLAISADEQVEFLRRFLAGELDIAERTAQTVRELLVLEETPAYRLSGKTGWAGLGEEDGREIGWLVGWLERDDGVHIYALNIDIRTNADAALRLSILRSILLDLGLIDAPPT